jgi:hypothetical protein
MLIAYCLQCMLWLPAIRCVTLMLMLTHLLATPESVGRTHGDFVCCLICMQSGWLQPGICHHTSEDLHGDSLHNGCGDRSGVTSTAAAKLQQPAAPKAAAPPA